MENLHQPNDIIDRRYRIVTPLGQGSMGTTYEAEDLTSYQRVAIKTVSLRQATDWKILELFEREARVLANLNHPNIPNYLNYFYVDSEGDRIFYLVRELVGGDSLANLVQRGWHLEEERVQQIAVQVLETLDYLHRLNPPIIHRDIKPENLIVDRSGKVFLVDFGSVADVYRQTISLSNTFVGTLGYMAPEQFRGQVKPASDLYSLGATLVFILTGRSPVDLPQVRMKIDFRDRVSISPQFADWLDKMLEPMLEDRFTSAREALDGIFYRGYRPVIVTKKPDLIQPQKTQIIEVERQPPPAHTNIYLENNAMDFFANFFNEDDLEKNELFFNSLTFVFLLCFVFFIATNIHSLVFFGLLFFFGLGTLTFGAFTVANPSNYTVIEINSKKFYIDWRIAGILVRRFEGLTCRIDKVGLSTDNSARSYCTILAGVDNDYNFGKNLSRQEQEWLVGEIKYFLNKIRQ